MNINTQKEIKIVQMFPQDDQLLTSAINLWESSNTFQRLAPDFMDLVSDFRNQEQRQDMFFLVAKYKERVVGILYADEPVNIEDITNILYLYVEYKRLGIGKRLVQSMIQHAKLKCLQRTSAFSPLSEKGYEIFSRVTTTSQSALSFWLDMGFSVEAIPPKNRVDRALFQVEIDHDPRRLVDPKLTQQLKHFLSLKKSDKEFYEFLHTHHVPSCIVCAIIEHC